ncbi:hypothetical protein [Vulcanisaeta distributa]|uniref:hypothetical protein n=1 Tax=Vulcanisaeta distributa TaxID=164451 RepID=UPI001FB2C99F|nr:hypothetical protein [Vulcanisaeta distributa]
MALMVSSAALQSFSQTYSGFLSCDDREVDMSYCREAEESSAGSDYLRRCYVRSGRAMRFVRHHDSANTVLWRYYLLPAARL